MAQATVRIGDERREATFGEGLASKCGDCDCELNFAEDFDSDGVPYTAECCGYWYKLRPVTVTLWRERQDITDAEP